jgi:deoxyadenosine/deoxycytidine kinase
MSFNTNGNIIISIEGNIGSGKSTLMENLKKNKYYNKFIFLREPVDKWENIKDKNNKSILSHFYEDKEKYSFPFQIMAYMSRLNMLKTALTLNKNKIIISERSLLTDKSIFAQMLYDSGFIDDIHHQIYMDTFNVFQDINHIDKIIYMKCTPKICYERIQKRARDGESNISLEYLEKCNEYHEKMMDENYYIDQLILNGNVELSEEVLDEWYRSIYDFISK